jgi:hypothetical protein
MVEIQANKRFTLLCNQVDPNDPNRLSCEILRKIAVSKKGAAPKALSTTPSPNQSESDTVKPSSDVTDDAKSEGYEMIEVLKLERDGKEYLEIIKSSAVPAPEVKETPIVSKAESNLAAHRLAQESKCDEKHCPVSRLALLRQNKPAKQDDTGGKGI